MPTTSITVVSFIIGLILLCTSLHVSGSSSASSSSPSPSSSSSPSHVAILTDENFSQLVQPESGNNGDWFVEFYAPWCGHCKSLAPIWEQLASSVSQPTSSPSDRSIHIGQLDATVEFASAKRFDIRSFPSLKLFRQGKMFDYKGPRTLEALEKFVRTGGEGSHPTQIPEPPTQIAVAFEYFLSMASDVQIILMRRPLSGIIFFGSGILIGIILSAIIFASCLEKTPNEWVQYRDPATGQLVTVPYVRTMTMSPSPTSPTSPLPMPTLPTQPTSEDANESTLRARANKKQ